jgi:hypothetical protein
MPRETMKEKLISDMQLSYTSGVMTVELLPGQSDDCTRIA